MRNDSRLASVLFLRVAGMSVPSPHSYEHMWYIPGCVRVVYFQVILGLYIIRGDNIALVGEVDEQIDGATDWSKTKAEPLKHIVH